MPAPLTSILAALWVVCVAGATAILLFNLGWTGWMTVVVSGTVGLVIGIPAGIWNVHEIERQDSGWPPDRSRSAGSNFTQF